MKLAVLITSKVESGLEVANAWQDAGAPGVTIINSHGLYSLQQQTRDGSMELPISAAHSMEAIMAYVLRESQFTNHMILSLVPKEMIDDLVAATTKVLGDLLSPHTGVFFVVPIDQTIGVRQHGDD